MVDIYDTMNLLGTRRYQHTNQLALNTKLFRKADVSSFKIKYSNCKNGDIFPVIDDADLGILIPKHLYLRNWTLDTLISAHFKYSEEEMNFKEKMLVLYLSNIYVGNETATIKSKTDAFVEELLKELKFYPLRFKTFPKHHLYCNGKRIESEPSFSFENDIGEVIMICNDDKNMRVRDENSADFFGGEDQIAGDMLAAAFMNWEGSGKNQVIYAVRVIDTNFTFYKAEISSSYLKSLEFGFPKDESIAIHRHPQENQSKTCHFKNCTIYDFEYPAFNYLNPIDRKTVLNLLSRILLPNHCLPAIEYAEKNIFSNFVANKSKNLIHKNAKSIL